MDKSVNISLNDGTALLLQHNGLYKAQKLFLSPINEEKWLNYMASKGYELCGRKISGYLFAKSPQANKSYYSVGYSAVSSSKGCLNDLTKSEVEAREKENSTLACTYCTKVYYKTHNIVGANTNNKGKSCASDSPLNDAASKRAHIRNRFVFFLTMFCFFLGLLCYNLMHWVRFSTTGVYVKFTGGLLNDYIEKEHSLWDITFDLRGWFGNYPCVPHISLFLGLTIVFIPFAVYYLDQYLYARNFEKQLQLRWKTR